jgi:hypothetical protein
MLRKVEGVGEAHIVRGDPRLPVTDMDAWYQAFLTENYPAKARPHIYGADAGLCARRNVLLEHNVWISGSKTAASNAYMTIGIAMENMLAHGLRKGGRLVATQVKLPAMPEVYVSGYIDLIIFDAFDELSIIEVKTCGKLPLEIKPVHLAQVQFYAAASGIPKAWVTYISREVRSEFGANLAMRTFAVPLEEEVLRSRLQTAAMSKLASAQHKLPPVPAHFRKHTECHYCEFRDAYCWRSRPGLGGDEPQPPLPALTPLEMIELELRSIALADSMLYAMPERYGELLAQLDKDSENREIRKILADLAEVHLRRSLR